MSFQDAVLNLRSSMDGTRALEGKECFRQMVGMGDKLVGAADACERMLSLLEGGPEQWKDRDSWLREKVYPLIGLNSEELKASLTLLSCCIEHCHSCVLAFNNSKQANHQGVQLHAHWARMLNAYTTLCDTLSFIDLADQHRRTMQANLQSA